MFFSNNFSISVKLCCEIQFVDWRRETSGVFSGLVTKGVIMMNWYVKGFVVKLSDWDSFNVPQSSSASRLAVVEMRKELQELLPPKTRTLNSFHPVGFSNFMHPSNCNFNPFTFHYKICHYRPQSDPCNSSRPRQNKTDASFNTAFA